MCKFSPIYTSFCALIPPLTCNAPPPVSFVSVVSVIDAIPLTIELPPAISPPLIFSPPAESKTPTVVALCMKLIVSVPDPSALNVRLILSFDVIPFDEIAPLIVPAKYAFPDSSTDINVVPSPCLM